MAKPIDLGRPNLKFRSIKDGKAYFDKILQNTPDEHPVTEADFLDVLALYEVYCAKTEWPMPSRPRSFFPTYEAELNYRTRCFGIEFEDGRKDRFSLDKALSKAAK